ncbi:hypothetical protein D9757_001907 [Collybiopsis confluens]|uniref:Uncharacterized protein n=1 Tax=Collybiopsis confluens TaxID=2823264 RepID=A0A8H5HXM6_9AGAR|nr:hypothetical protein D9757_001907 [Collybiopsis confluens]
MLRNVYWIQLRRARNFERTIYTKKFLLKVLPKLCTYTASAGHFIAGSPGIASLRSPLCLSLFLTHSTFSTMAVERLLATRAQRLFIATLLIQAVVVLAMVGITFRMVEDHISFTTSGYKTLPCYLALFALAEIFEIFMAIDALRLRNIIQLVGIILFHLALIVSAALQVHQTKDALVNGVDCSDPSAQDYLINCDVPGSLWRKILPFLVVTPCVIAASWLIILFWVKQLYGEFGWAIFHILDLTLVSPDMYQYYQVEICLLKFDFFFFTGVTMQLLIVVLSRNSAEFGITIAAIPIVLGLLMGAAMAVKREIKWLMSLSLVTMLAAETYFSKLTQVNLSPAVKEFEQNIYS